MTTGTEWRQLSRLKLRSVERLMKYREWVLAAEQMGYTLECALKAACSKNMKHSVYPPLKPNSSQEISFFKTHEFEALLIYSGLSDILGVTSLAWGNFVTEYSGSTWPEMRYDINADKKFTQVKVTELYNFLYANDDSILKLISRKRRW